MEIGGRYFFASIWRHLFFSPSLPPDVPRTPGTRWMESQPAVSTGHPAAGTPALSRGHLSRGHIRTASTRLDRASYA
jgi:hypothetical protein